MAETNDKQGMVLPSRLDDIASTNNTEPIKQSNWTELLDETMLAEIFSFCTPPELIRLRCVNSTFLHGSKLALKCARVLHLSFLAQLEEKQPSLKSNTTKPTKHQKGRKRLRSSPCSLSSSANYTEKCLSYIIQDAGPNVLEKIECEGLRHVTGSYSNWLHHLFSFTKLKSIDFSGCSKLHPRCFQNALEQVSRDGSGICQSLTYLNLQGCARMDSQVVQTIAQTLPKLQHLLLGLCSTSIDNNCVKEIFHKLHDLRTLDLSGFKHITDSIFEMVDVARVYLPPKLEHLHLAACEKIRFTWLQPLVHNMFHALHNADATTNKQSGAENLFNLVRNIENWKKWRDFVQFLIVNTIGQHNALERHHQLINPSWEGQLSMINFEGIGTPRLGLVNGALGLFACLSRGKLREVRVSGSEQIDDNEILILASSCRKSLVCLEMSACEQIGDDSLKAIGEWCEVLAELDISACFRITDDGIMQLCPDGDDGDRDEEKDQQNDISVNDEDSVPTMKQRKGCSTLRSLNMSSLPLLTDAALPHISKLPKLLHLDVRNCYLLTAFELSKTVLKCSTLIEVDARDTDNPRLLPGLVKPEDALLASGKAALRFVNGRRYRHAAKLSESMAATCCSVNHCSRRLESSQGVALQIMHHCIDCQLLPSYQRGVCTVCVDKCHKGHRTFIGALSRFYCDCAFLNQNCNSVNIQ